MKPKYYLLYGVICLVGLPMQAMRPETEKNSQFESRSNETVILNGIDVLKRDQFRALQGLSIGLITNQTGHDIERNSTIDILYQARGIFLKALFSPEHGIRGELDQPEIGNEIDKKTNLPIFSLYGANFAPTKEQLKDIDALVFDIQDIGTRFYTYISTLGHCLEAAGKLGIKFFVLDRVNPISGAIVDGPVVLDEHSFTGYHDIAIIHGMTVGELALMFNDENELRADLNIIKVSGWQRNMAFDKTNLPWTNLSPNMRNLTQSLLYPGIALLEMCHLSVGRGTDTPFEIVGAPYVKDVELAHELNKLNLTGVSFVPVCFKPRASKFKDQKCFGVNIIILDREKFSAIDVGISIAITLKKLYSKNFDLKKINVLLNHFATIQAIEEGKSLIEIRNLWIKDFAEFLKRREQYLLY